MIVVPKTEKEYRFMANFLQAYAHVTPTADLQVMGWVTDDKLRLCVGFNAFLGKVCQIHVAMEPGFDYTPKEMLRSVFQAAFLDFQRELLIGIVNSNNEKAMKYDLHLGFKEVTRFPKMHDDGGDIVILSLAKEDCKYLTQPLEAAA